MPYVAVSLSSVLGWMYYLLVTHSDPFVRMFPTADNGQGMNALLQNPYMAVHPPMLYLGFTTFAIPYAFCIGALLSGNLSNEWIQRTRRWTLIAWGFLTIGIVLGGHWAYLELGWGGFWAWDPVENSSFLPWLTGTAFVHSVMVQERKNMLKMWNVWLIVLTYGLTVFGTFLTRSGIVQSIHAFASTDIGWIFLVYLAAIAVSAIGLTWFRRRQLRSERTIESLFSREAAFLLNNLVFLSICFAVLWGVMFPVLSEAVTGKKQTIGIPFFNAVTIPMFLFMLFLMGVGPLVPWRRSNWVAIRKTFLSPFIFSLVVAVALVFAGITSFYPVLAYSLSCFVVGSILVEINRGLRLQKALLTNDSGGTEKNKADNLVRLIRKNRSRYGGYVVHLGVALMTVAITASMAHKVEREFTLAIGETYTVGRFGFKVLEITDQAVENYEALRVPVQLSLAKSGEILQTLYPELRRYRRNNESTSEVAIRSGLREDVYLVLAGLDQSQTRAALKLFINPLQSWLWLGALVMVFGTLIVLIPGLRPDVVADSEAGGRK